MNKDLKKKTVICMITVGFLFITVLSLSAQLSFGQDALNSLPVAPSTVQIDSFLKGRLSAGDVVVLKITPPKEVADAMPSIAQDLEKGPVPWGEGRVLWWKPLDSTTETIEIGLTSYMPGKLEIKPIPFKKGDQLVFSTQPQTVEFFSVGGNKEQDDIYPPEAVSFPRWVWVVIGLFSLIAALAFIWWFTRRIQAKKESRKKLANAPRIFTPLEEFQKLCEEIERKDWLTMAKHKPFYFAISDGAKRFLGKSFRFDAEDRTTRELIQELENLGFSEDLRGQWRSVFEEMDIVKFTDQKPDLQMAKTLSSRLLDLAKITYGASPAANSAKVSNAI